MNKENCALKLVDEIILYYDARSKKHQISLLFLLHNTPKKSCKIEYKVCFTSLLVYMSKNIQVKNDEGMGHDMLWPNQVGFRIWPATRFEFHRPVSNCHCRVLCFERKLICRLSLPTPFFTSEPSFFPYFAVEL